MNAGLIVAAGGVVIVAVVIVLYGRSARWRGQLETAKKWLDAGLEKRRKGDEARAKPLPTDEENDEWIEHGS